MLTNAEPATRAHQCQYHNLQSTLQMFRALQQGSRARQLYSARSVLHIRQPDQSVAREILLEPSVVVTTGCIVDAAGHKTHEDSLRETTRGKARCWPFLSLVVKATGNREAFYPLRKDAIMVQSMLSQHEMLLWIFHRRLHLFDRHQEDEKSGSRQKRDVMLARD